MLDFRRILRLTRSYPRTRNGNATATSFDMRASEKVSAVIIKNRRLRYERMWAIKARKKKTAHRTSVLPAIHDTDSTCIG